MDRPNRRVALQQPVYSADRRLNRTRRQPRVVACLACLACPNPRPNPPLEVASSSRQRALPVSSGNRTRGLVRQPPACLGHSLKHSRVRRRPACLDHSLKHSRQVLSVERRLFSAPRSCPPRIILHNNRNKTLACWAAVFGARRSSPHRHRILSLNNLLALTLTVYLLRLKRMARTRQILRICPA